MGFKSYKIKEFLHLFTSNIVGIPIGIITSIYLTRYLGSKAYGDYQFINNIFNVVIIVVAFGFLYSGNRVMVLLNDKKKSKEIYGAEFVLTMLVYIVMSVLLFIYIQLDNNIREKGMTNYLMYLIPFGWVFLFSRYFEVLLQADNQVKILSYVRFLPKVGFMIIMLIISYFSIFTSINKVALVWISFIAVQIIVYSIVFIFLGLSFNNLYANICEIWRMNKVYGLDVYVGSLFAVGFSQFTGLIISYFSNDNVGVGFYSLSITLCAPLIFIPNTIATIFYKEFASMKIISKKMIIITYAVSAVSLVVLWICIGPFVHIFYGASFQKVVGLNYIVSIGVMMHGLADFYNRYFCAKGLGKVLRNSSFIVGLSVMIFNIILIPKWGENGAAYARLLSGFVYYFIMYYNYSNYVKKNNALFCT